jgi:quercetin dioxygenase-like cupin family protein
MAAVLSAGPLGLIAGCTRPDDEEAAKANGSTSARQDSARLGWGGAVIQPDQGELLVSGRRRGAMRIKVDSTTAIGATMSMVVSEVQPGASIPVHLHRNEDELIFLHTGSGIVTLGDERIPAVAGAVLYSPRNVWHGIENTGRDVITWCAIYSPPGFEQYFREVATPPGGEGVAPPPEHFVQTALKYGMVFRDP